MATKYLLTIPAKNEETTICKVISNFLFFAKSNGIDLSIQVVDDHSTDDTYSKASSTVANVISNNNKQGLAFCFREEMVSALKTNADVIIHTDADGQYSPLDLMSLIQKYHEGFDLVLGNRLLNQPEGMSNIRYKGNILLSQLISELINIKIYDSQTGYRVFSRRIAEEITIISKFTYTQEQIIRAAHLNFKIAEIPIRFFSRPDKKSRLMRSPFEYLQKVAEDLEHVVADIYPELLEYSSKEDVLK